MPQKAGDRGHTDRREAVHLARLMRSGPLPPVDVPAVHDDALRDLSRAREDARPDLTPTPCRLNALRRRHDSRSTARATWGPAHLRWLRAVVGPTPAQPLGFQASVRARTEHTARLQRRAQARPEPVTAWRLCPVVDALQARRGVQWPVAVTTVAALGDLARGDNPRPLRQSLGLTPSEYARGERRRPGGIAKTGHTQARRALVEGAGASRDPATVSRHLQLRLEPLPKPLQDTRRTAQVRRCTR
jgi:transposase